MKYLYLIVILLPLIFGAPQERFLIHVDLSKVVDVVKGIAHSGMGHTACVTACEAALASTVIGLLGAPLCGAACTEVLKHVK